jgi:hypothetical protein
LQREPQGSSALAFSTQSFHSELNQRTVTLPR